MALIACRHCDLLVNTVDIRRGQTAICPRCQQIIYLDQRSFDTSVALLFTALLTYFPAILLPFLSMKTAGQTHQVSLLSSILEIAKGDMLPLAITVFSLVIFFPLVKIVGLLLIMLPLSQNRLPLIGVTATRILLLSSPWSMVEVYLVGVLVTLVKLTGIAKVDYAEGFFAFILLIIINAFINLYLPQKRIWQRIAEIKSSPLTTAVIQGTANNH